MYQCLLKNELLGSEIERIKDCHSEDRRITGSPCSEKKNLFKVLSITVVPNQGPRYIKQGAMKPWTKNTYFGHECDRKFWEIPQRNF